VGGLLLRFLLWRELNPPLHLTSSPPPTHTHAPPGLACLGTCDEEVFEDLKNTLYTDDAVAGEAAGLAMGMLLCGSSSDKAQEMLVSRVGGWVVAHWQNDVIWHDHY